ncbi:beta strand repeat-containing protein [Edaphobacter bradus]|uniref:beta strand repeat-containing protein n=1 Tax=Edaphobacter bradus TaxID=2259016 RepID=UPI0021DF9A9F|nr:IPT/TIG domain-containing protein [Edaphobacter bradus]
MKTRLVRSVSAALLVSALFALCLNGCSSGSSGSSSTPTPATVTSVSPTSVTVGAAATTITVTGSNFISTSVVQIAGVSEPTTFVSATQLQASVPSSLFASAALLPVAVLNGSTTSATGQAVNLEIDNPSPTISSFSPANFIAGVTNTPLVIAGSGFVSTSSAQVNGSARPTTYISPTQLNVAFTASDLAAAGTLSVKIANPSPGGGTSAAASVPVNNPIPTGLVLTPSTVTVGAPAATITVTGSGFLSNSVVNVNGSARSTTLVDATHLTFTLAATDQATQATLAVTVTNPAPGGGTSLPTILAVDLPALTPTIASLSPTQFIVGSPDSTLLVNGTNFTNKSVVQWNGSPLATPFHSGSTRLFATVPAALLASVGTASVTVTTPTATPGTSNTASIAITTPPAPAITSINPNSAPIGTATRITVYGTNFTASSTVSFNGTVLTTTYGSSTSLTAQIPSNLDALPGNGSITVTTPAPGGGTSSSLAFTSYIPIVNNSMVYNPANGLLYVSVPSSAGAPYGDSVVSVDPATGALGNPILVGSEPNKLAISSDGTTLWVGLDGAAAVRQVNLTSNTAGLQFGLGGNSGIYANPLTALALAALPGSPNSVVVSLSNSIAIFDNGVRRGPAPTNNYLYNSGYALQVDGTKSEIYVAANSDYYVYTYNSTGITLKTTATTGTYAAAYGIDDLQATGGRIYADSGHAYDVESGALLGTFYASGTTPASGPIVADTALGKAFVLDYSSLGYGYNQIQTFNSSDYTSASSSVIPVNGVSSIYTGTGGNPSHLTRWGTNGLAFRASNGVFSLRSNLVKDLSSTSADLGVAIAASGSNTTGSNTTYTVTVSNAGPSDSTNVVLTALVPSSGVLVSATPSQGTCAPGSTIQCNLGGITNGSSTTITIVVQQTTAGQSTLTAQVTGSEADNSLANNQATSTVTVTGNGYNVAPTLSSISPAAILAGSTDTTVTVNGTGFTSATTVLLNGSPISTSVSSNTQLTALVPSSSLTTLGWAAISVSTPTPGGGVSTVLPLSIYKVITVGVNHILYDPFTRKLYASVGSGSATVTGNSIAAITPETGSIGTPIPIGSQPTALALSDDGQILYTILTGSSSIARFNMLTQKADFSYTPASNTYSASTNGFRDIAVLSGSENTIALDLGYTSGLGLYDFDPTNKTASLRGAVTGLYSGTSLHFLNPNTLLVFNSDTWQTLDSYPITSAGLQYYNNTQRTSSTLLHFGSFKLSGGLAFANNGGAADPSTTPATQLGYYAPLNQNSYANQVVAPDTSLSRVFFLGSTSTSTSYTSNVDGIIAYDQKTFLPTAAVSLNMAATEGTNTSYNGVDLIRWGQDGLAALTSGGHIYILRGPVVVPQLLNQNAAATLTAATPGSITNGAGNTLITVTGSGFLQGAAVTWNGSYRTTTWVDSSHLTVAIPASDLAAAGSATLIVTNPGASASSSITFTIN